MSSTVFRLSVAFLVGVLALLALSFSLSDYYGDEQQRLMAAGDTRGALEALRLSARLDPFDTDALEAQASILQQQNQFERAEDALRQAIERDPVNYLPHLFLANLQLDRGDRDAAVESYRDVLRLNPKATAASIYMAQVLTTQGKLEEAKEEYSKLERERRISAQALYDLGRIEVRTGEAEEGLRDINRARRQTRAELGELEGAAREQRERYLISMDLAMADALVVAGREAGAREILAESPSEQAPSLLQLLDSSPDEYREQVVNSEIY
jgi:tetratricopeptide (TPR) repeat protein